MSEQINLRGLNGPAAMDSQKWLWKSMMAVMLADQQSLGDTWEDAFDAEKTFDVSLTIDGVEVPFTRLVERLQEGFDFAVSDAIRNHLPEWMTAMEHRLFGTIQNFAQSVASEGKHVHFWVVLNPFGSIPDDETVSQGDCVLGPSLDDILFECSLVEFANQVRGGLNEDEIAGVYAYEREEEAEAHAKQLLERCNES